MSPDLQNGGDLNPAPISAYTAADFRVDDIKIDCRKMMSEDGNESTTEVGVISGYAGVFSNVDRQDDIIEPGAFSNLTSRNARGALKVKMFLDHDHTRRPGIWTSLSQDDKGLLARGEFNLSTNLGRETYEEVKNGSLDAMSVGFRIPKGGAYYDKPEDEDSFSIRRITKAELFEISLVPIPANPEATIDGIKNFDVEEVSERMLERLMQNQLGMSRRQAKSFLQFGYKGLQLRSCDEQEAAAAGKATIDAQDAEDRARKIASDRMIAAALELRKMREEFTSDPVMKGFLR